MSWDCLAEEIGGMFDTYSWRADDYQRALEICSARIRAERNEYQNQYRRQRPELRKAAVAYTTEWRRKNRDKARLNSQNSYRRRKARAAADPAYAEHLRTLQRAKARRYREKNPDKRERDRHEYWAKYQAKRRDKLAAAKAELRRRRDARLDAREEQKRAA